MQLHCSINVLHRLLPCRWPHCTAVLCTVLCCAVFCCQALASYDADLSAKNISNDFDWIKVCRHHSCSVQLSWYLMSCRHISVTWVHHMDHMHLLPAATTSTCASPKPAHMCQMHGLPLSRATPELELHTDPANFIEVICCHL